MTVRPFFGDPDDDELPHLARYLTKLAAVPNVRTVEKRGWRSAEQNSEDSLPSPMSREERACLGEGLGERAKR